MAGGGGGGGGGELWRGGDICTNVSNGISTLQGIQMCQIILKYIFKYRRNGPDKLNL